jgi:hypothetical protein
MFYKKGIIKLLGLSSRGEIGKVFIKILLNIHNHSLQNNKYYCCV